MKVSCPNCNTSYELDDAKIKKERMKMRCSRCKHAFYFKTKTPATSIPTPQAGFEEFSQNPKSQEAFEEFAAPDSTVPNEFQNISASPQPPAAPPSAPPQRPVSAAPAAPISETSSGSFDIYETGVSAWDLTPSLIIDAPDETDEASPSESKTTQLAGQVMFSLVIATILFFLFVAFRNHWSLNFGALPEQIAGAFSSAPHSDIPDIARGLEITVAEKKMLTGAQPKLIVRGEVFNQTGEPRQAILLRGRLRDVTDTVIAEVKAPCDIVLDEDELATSSPGAHRKKYVRSGSLLNCRLNIDGSTIFQLVFDNLPEGFELDNHNVSAQVISAQP